MTERTSVLTVKARRSGAPALEARAVWRPAVRRLGAVALGFAGGWAVLYGALMPFGLGLVLGLAEDCFAPCAAGAALGVLLHGFGALSLRSVCLLCALGAAVAVRWVWPGRFLPAVLAGCGTLAAMGLCFALGTGGGAELALFCTADALLAGLLGLALRRFPPEKPGFGTLLTGAAVAAALDKAEATGAPAGAMVLPDGRIITGKTSGTLGAAAALLLNALKALGNIDDQFELISKQVLEPVCHLKTTYLDHRNPRLHTDEVLLTLAISALTNPLADLAKRQLPGLRDSEAHFSVIISEEDLKIFKRLGVRVSCEPKYETKRLYHR